MFLYKGTTPDYWLDYQSLDQWMMHWRNGKECQVEEARILLGVIVEALMGKEPKPLPKLIITPDDQKPDRKAFYRHYGDKITRG